MTVIANVEEFNETLKRDKVMVDFYATWCGPCQQIAPYYEELQKNNPDISFLKVNSDEFESLSEKYEVKALPTFIIFKAGKEIGRISGAGKPRLDELLNTLKTAK